MEDNPIPIYVIEFMSDEWKTWALFSIIFISIPLILGRFLDRKRKIQVTYAIGGIMIIDFIAEHLFPLMNGTWDLQYNIPLHLCGISSIICCILPFVKKKEQLFQFVYYTGIIGGIMAILTPQLNYFDGTLRYYLNFFVSFSILGFPNIFLYISPPPPTITVPASLYPSEVFMIIHSCPSIVLLLVNTYVVILFLPAAVSIFCWDLPYMVTDL